MFSSEKMNSKKIITTCEFSYNHYIETLKLYQKEYSIGTLNNYQKLKKNKSFIILRHDVDFSLDSALQFAKEEEENNLTSTFFILLHSPYYNALSPKNSKIVLKISEMGHEIGLHYDTTMMPSKKQKIVSQIKNEINLLSDIIGKKVTSIAQHNVSVNQNISKLFSNENFQDAFDPKILDNLEYLSDSVQNWRKGCMCNHVGKHPRMQILTHPLWWDKIATQRKDVYRKFNLHENKKIKDLIEDNKIIHKNYFEKVLKKEKLF